MTTPHAVRSSLLLAAAVLLAAPAAAEEAPPPSPQGQAAAQAPAVAGSAAPAAPAAPGAAGPAGGSAIASVPAPEATPQAPAAAPAAAAPAVTAPAPAAPDAAAPAPNASTAPMTTAPAANEATAATAPATTAAAATPASAALPRPAPARRPAETAWYRPSDAGEADSELPWNSSVLGAFDPWTKAKITLLGQMHSLAIDFPSAKGFSSITAANGTSSKIQYPAARLSGDFRGGRFEWGNWSAAVATGNAALTWGDASSGSPVQLSGKMYEVLVARGFGAWAVHDFGLPDVRIGISWPELYVRALFFTQEFKNFAPGVQRASFYGAGLGVSVAGLRVTAGDLFFAELRAGQYEGTVLGADVALTPADPTAKAEQDVVLQRRVRFTWTPLFRLGIAL